MSSTFAILTCLWKRPEVARLVLAHTATVARAVAAERGGSVVLLAVGSEGLESPEHKMAVELGWEYITLPNSPLGSKWNGGMQALRTRADAVMCIGSDDIVTEGLIHSAWDSVLDGKSLMWGCRDIFFLTYGPQLMYWSGYQEDHPRHGEPIGCGRTLWSGLLDLLDWTPWPDTLERGLDHGMWMKCRNQIPEWETRCKVEYMKEAGGDMIDIKLGHVSIGGYSYELGKPANIDDDINELSGETLATLIKMATRPKFEPCAIPFVSACLMVKNEAEHIRACLESLHGHVDEVTVMDTGSTDGTPEIAEEYGALVRRCSAESPFDFAQWRNASLKLGRGEWILIMDGKDKLVNGHLLKEQLHQIPAEANAIAVHTQGFADAKRNIVQGTNSTLRVLRGDDVRSNKLRYIYPVHHQLTGITNFVLLKHTYVEKTWVDVTESARRNLPVLQKMLTTSGASLIKANGREMTNSTKERHHALLYIARTHMVIAGGCPEGSKEAREHFEQAAIFAGKLIDEKAGSPLAWITLFQAVESSRGMQFVGPLVAKAVEAHPNCVEFYWWQMRTASVWIAALVTQPDQFPLVPQRCDIRRLPECAGFLRLRYPMMESPKDQPKV